MEEFIEVGFEVILEIRESIKILSDVVQKRRKVCFVDGFFYYFNYVDRKEDFEVYELVEEMMILVNVLVVKYFIGKKEKLFLL